jgi:hypothetical protein
MALNNIEINEKGEIIDPRSVKGGPDIFRAIQARKEANEAAGRGDPLNPSFSSLMGSGNNNTPSSAGITMGGMTFDGGGAAAAMARRNAQLKQTTNENIAYPRERQTPVTPRQSVPAKVFIPENTVDVNNLVTEMKLELVALRNSGNYTGVLKYMFMLYAADELSTTRISGLTGDDKAELLGILDEFRAMIDSVIK